jgi:hypothetical protein
MDLNKKYFPIFLSFIILGMIIGSIGWEIFERLIRTWGSTFSLTLENPIGFDLYIISFFFRVNVGTLLGAVSGVILFKVM